MSIICPTVQRTENLDNIIVKQEKVNKIPKTADPFLQGYFIIR